MSDSNEPPYAQPDPQAAPYAAYPTPPAGYGYGGPVEPRGLSIASMVLGIVSVLGIFVLGLGFLPGIAAIITAVMARKRQPGGKPFWLTGLITGIVGTVLGLVVIAFYVVVIAIGVAHASSVNS